MMKNNSDFAIIKYDKSQYMTFPGDFLDVEKIEGDVGKEVVISDVLVVKIGDDIEIGKPVIKDAKVICEITQQSRDRKVRIFKYAAKARYRKTKGHRQAFTRLLVKKIVLGDKESLAKKSNSKDENVVSSIKKLNKTKKIVTKKVDSKNEKNSVHRVNESSKRKIVNGVKNIKK